MLTFDEAKRIGITTCINTLGVDFVKKFAATSSSAYGYSEDGESVFCFVGVDNTPQPEFDGKTLTLTSEIFPYRVSCDVSLHNGNTVLLECVTP